MQALNAGAHTHVSAKAANVYPLQTIKQDLLGVINTSTKLLLNHSLISSGACGGTVNIIGTQWTSR
ncbi:hypothetical protein MUBE_12380 [Mycobacterium uberis]|uniref:Uncharacterized protein n=1 Tax=Mycobacterium uberis TaxID=2162698 RepID=A0A3E1HE36_9MYCO|nr:hypothetical protein [Mycobacterium uberis]RFD24700.1 hypothetical protein MUBE_12380 [Mycobacterium uberis]